MSNENALKSLPTLFLGTALLWWSGVKTSFNEWDDAVSALRSAFSKAKPAHQIFNDIFCKKQDPQVSTELFICEVRALLAKLPYVLDEVVQLDMVYCQLCLNIRKRVPRNNFKDFKQLIQEAKTVEETLLEENEVTVGVGVDKSNDIKTGTVNKLFCSFCKKLGRNDLACRKLAK